MQSNQLPQTLLPVEAAVATTMLCLDLQKLVQDSFVCQLETS